MNEKSADTKSRRKLAIPRYSDVSGFLTNHFKSVSGVILLVIGTGTIFIGIAFESLLEIEPSLKIIGVSGGAGAAIALVKTASSLWQRLHKRTKKEEPQRGPVSESDAPDHDLDFGVPSPMFSNVDIFSPELADHGYLDDRANRMYQSQQSGFSVLDLSVAQGKTGRGVDIRIAILDPDGEQLTGINHRSGLVGAVVDAGANACDWHPRLIDFAVAPAFSKNVVTVKVFLVVQHSDGRYFEGEGVDDNEAQAVHLPLWIS
jgi:hypothetical protein